MKVNDPSLDDELMNRLKGEARFIRAFFYTRLTMLYGAVPLLTKTIDIEEAKSLTRTPQDQVWDFVEAELTEIADHLEKNYTGDNIGRITKGAALAMKARAMLYAERWDKAAAIYAFQGFKPFISSLKRAYSRNVNLHVMFDMSNHNEDLVLKNRATAKAIKSFKNEREIEIIYVDNDAGSIAINHNKFILFTELETETGTIENVVFQTSHNFTESDTYRIQDAVTLSNEGLYQAYLTYWQDMRALAGGGMTAFEYREYNDPEAGITAYFHPKRKDGAFLGDDTMIQILDDITEPSTSIIKIGMSGWADSRVSIVEKLDELLSQGATIEVITKSSIGPDVYEGLRVLQQKGAFIKIYNMDDPNQQRINIHTKFMLIEGQWRGEETNMVITGSQNFSINALKYNNETTLLFKDHEFFEVYTSYYEKLKTLPGVCCS